MSETAKLTTAYIISLVAGILIFLGSLYTKMWGTWMMGGGYIGMMGGIGSMMGQLGDMMSGSTIGGGMMDGGMMQQQQPAGEMSIAEDEAKSIAQEYLNEYFPGTTVVESTTFYGYYTFDFGMNDKIQGILSVNGHTGQVWYHGWHGDFIQMKEFHD